MNEATLQLILPPVIGLVLFLLMFIVGQELTVADFRRAGQQKGLVLLAMLLQLVVTPLVSVGLILLLKPAPAIAAGILLVAVCPSGGLANFYTYLARGHLALAVTLTAISCFLCAATMPLTLSLLRGFLPEAGALDLPVPMMVGQLIGLLVLPVLVGMFVRHRWPEWAKRNSKHLLRVGLLGMVGLIVLVMTMEQKNLSGDFGEVALAVTLLTVIMMAVGFGAAWLGGWSSRDGFALAMVLSVRNVSVAIAVAAAMLGKLEFALFGIAYFLNQVPLLLGAVAIFRWLTGKPPAMVPLPEAPHSAAA